MRFQSGRSEMYVHVLDPIHSLMIYLNRSLFDIFDCKAVQVDYGVVLSAQIYGRLVQASASGAVDSGFIPSWVQNQ